MLQKAGFRNLASFRKSDPSLDRPISKKFSKIFVDGEEVELPEPDGEELEESPYIFMIFSENGPEAGDITMHFFLVHEKAYDQLFVKLYVLNEKPKHFTKVYEKRARESFRDSTFQVWRIDSPTDLVVPEALDKEYMADDFPDEELYKDWYFGAKKKR